LNFNQNSVCGPHLLKSAYRILHLFKKARMFSCERALPGVPIKGRRVSRRPLANQPFHLAAILDFAEKIMYRELHGKTILSLSHQ
jgi:hypothetical protein